MPFCRSAAATEVPAAARRDTPSKAKVSSGAEALGSPGQEAAAEADRIEILLSDGTCVRVGSDVVQMYGSAALRLRAGKSNRAALSWQLAIAGYSVF